MHLRNHANLLFILILFFFSFAQSAEPFALIGSQLRGKMIQNGAEFENCLNQLIPGEINLDSALVDSMQIYADCQNVRIGRILVNQSGYLPGSEKVFYYSGTQTVYSVIDDSGEEIATGEIAGSSFEIPAREYQVRASNENSGVSGGDTRYTMSGSLPGLSTYSINLPGGLPENTKLRVVIGSDTSASFIISSLVYSHVKDALLKYFGVARSGDSESWFHPPSHIQDGVPGGWYDCGDHLKEAITQSYAAALLGLSAAALQDRDTDNYGFNHSNVNQLDDVPDVLREAKHGVDYVLASYHLANGEVASMNTSVGDFGYDHNWWGSPKFQEDKAVSRGGAPRSLRNEVWSTVVGRFSAATAFVSKLYEDMDAEFSSNALEVAKELYAYGKEQANTYDAFGSSSAYIGEATYEDDMALAAVALAWASGDQLYFNDLVNNTELGTKNENNGSLFTAGWLASGAADIFTHHIANTGWSSLHPLALWGFYKLLLTDESLMVSWGVDAELQEKLSRSVAMSIAFNMDQVDQLFSPDPSYPSIDLPVPVSPYTGNLTGSDGKIVFDPIWNSRGISNEWMVNFYSVGNVAESFVYWDVVRDLSVKNIPPAWLQNEGGALTWIPGTVEDWNVSEVEKLLHHQLNYFLGLNPWDISMVLGIGDKHPIHVHHRAANPEGRFESERYEYKVPVGGLIAGFSPNEIWDEHYNNHAGTELCISPNATLMIPVMGLSGSIQAYQEQTVNAMGGIQPSAQWSVDHRDGVLLIDGASDQSLELKIYSLTGNEVFSSVFGVSKNGSTRIPTDIVAGVYVIHVRGNRENQYSRLLNID